MDGFLYDRDIRHESDICHFMWIFAAMKASLVHYYKTLRPELALWV